MPYVAQVAIGRRPHLNVFGRDYDTVDGTGTQSYFNWAVVQISTIKFIVF